MNKGRGEGTQRAPVFTTAKLRHELPPGGGSWGGGGKFAAHGPPYPLVFAAPRAPAPPPGGLPLAAGGLAGGHQLCTK
ncbi:MAG: hypothetical protein WKG07_44150 [Hymenobacter sp.]